MNLKEIISSKVQTAIDNYDFSFAIEKAIDEINITDIIEDVIEDKVSEIDISSSLEKIIYEIVEDELEDWDITADIENSLELL